MHYTITDISKVIQQAIKFVINLPYMENTIK